MHNVKVKKDKLLETLHKNMETHEKDFELAWDAFKERAEANFQAKLQMVKDLQKGQQVELWVNMEIPQNHTEDYQRAIEMLQWEVNEDVNLTEQEFKQYVQDNWVWKGKFSMDNQLYTGAASPSTQVLATSSRRK